MTHFVADQAFNATLFSSLIKAMLEEYTESSSLELDIDFLGRDGQTYSDLYQINGDTGGNAFEFVFAGDLTLPTPGNTEGTIRYIDMATEVEGPLFHLSDFSIDYDQALVLLFTEPQLPHPLFVEIFSGGDLIELSAGNDAFNGLSGDDTIFGGAGADTLSGGNGLDVIRTGGNASGGEDGADVVSGGEGEDLIYAHSGQEVIDGGDGFDTLSFAEVEGGEGEVLGIVASLAEGVEQQVRVGHTIELTSIEILVGSAGNDVLSGNGLANQIDGGEGDDTLDGAGGEDLLDGGFGFDVANFDLVRAEVAVALTENGVRATTAQGTATLTEIEKVQFDDGALVFDIDSENVSFAYRIYAAAYGRTPDEDGLRFWTGVLDGRGEGPPDADDKEFVAGFFLTADEFTDLYGTDPTNEEYINALYQNVLHREADQAGYDFWLGVIASGQGKDDLLIWFTDSTENLDNTAPDLDNGIWVL